MTLGPDAGDKATTRDEDHRRRAVDTGVLWSEAVLLQIERVVDVGRVLIEQHRAKPWAVPGWDEAAYRQPWLRLEADRNFLLIAANNLLRAIEFLDVPDHVDTARLAPLLRLAPSVKVLRDCNEHWNEEIHAWIKKPSKISGRAFAELAQLGPEADIRSHQWSASGRATLAGVLALEQLRDAAALARGFYRELAEGWFVWNGWPLRDGG